MNVYFTLCDVLISFKVNDFIAELCRRQNIGKIASGPDLRQCTNSGGPQGR